MLNAIFSGKSSSAPKANKTEFMTVVGIDPIEKIIFLSHMTGSDRSTFAIEQVPFKAKPFDEEFYGVFSSALERYSEKFPAAQQASVTIVLPDSLVALDTISMPTMRRGKNQQSLDIMIREMYKNSAQLKINNSVVMQNKQFTTYAISMVRQNILSSLYAACAGCKMTPGNITFAAAAEANALQALNPKLKTATYAFMDIREDSTEIVLVNKGRTAGFFRLPFGHSILYVTRFAAEDMLFDHSAAELLVLNAEEKAKAKQLTMMQSDQATMAGQALSEQALLENEEDDENAEEESEEDTYYQSALTGGAAVTSSTTTKVLPKKQPRKLPKFMLRPNPVGEQGYVYENFRLFEKWVLNLIASNTALFSEPVKTVYVNLPEKYDCVYGMANLEAAENGVEFQSIGLTNLKESISQHLDQFGGFFDSLPNQMNNF